MTSLAVALPNSSSGLPASGPATGEDTSDGGFSFQDLLDIVGPPRHPSDAEKSNSSFTLHDLFSIVNPLQHVPIVSVVYRALTGDTIKPLERIAGDTLYGGFWGFVSSVANVAFEDITGKDFGQTAIAMLEGDDDDSSSGLASAAPPASAVQAPAVTASDYASIAPQLIATAAPVVLHRQASSVSAPRSAATPLNGRMSNRAALSQRATAAYKKSLARPPNYSPVSVPID